MGAWAVGTLNQLFIRGIILNLKQNFQKNKVFCDRFIL